MTHARPRRHPGPGQPAAGGVARDRQADRRDGRADRRPSAILTKAVVPQRDRRAGGDRRIDERGGAPAGHRRPARRRADAGRLRPDRCRCPAAGRPAAGRPVPDGRPVPGRWPAGRSARGQRPARPDGDHRHRPAAGRLPGRRADLGPRGDPARADPAAARRRDRGAARQSRAARCDDQAGRRLAGVAHPPGPGRGLRQHRGPARPARRSGPGRRRRFGPGAARLRAAGLPGDAGGGATCRCRRSCCSRASATWSGSATAG